MTDDEFRAHLIEVGRDAMGRNDGWRWWHPRHLARLLDFWEPLIRADERERQTAEWTGLLNDVQSVCAAAVVERDAARAEVASFRADERRKVAEEIAAEVQALLDAEKDSANMDRDWALLQCRSIARRIGGAS